MNGMLIGSVPIGISVLSYMDRTYDMWTPTSQFMQLIDNRDVGREKGSRYLTEGDIGISYLNFVMVLILKSSMLIHR